METALVNYRGILNIDYTLLTTDYLLITMTKTVPKIIYCLDESDLPSAQALQKNLQSRVDEEHPIIEIRTLDKSSSLMPEEIILLAHSDTPPKTIGGRSPEQLAADLAKNFKGNDKTALKSIKLAACEGGFGPNPLAQQLVHALHQQGFTKVEVQAATHPKESKHGGIVAITTKAGILAAQGVTPGQTTAVMYGNQITADYERYKDLKKIKQKTSEEQKDYEDILEKHQSFKEFDEKHFNYSVVSIVHDIDDLSAPYNTYTTTGRKAELSLDVAVTLDYLNHQKQTYKRLNSPKELAELSDLISHFKAHSSLDKDEILSYIGTIQQKKSILDSNKDYLKKIQKGIGEEIDHQRLSFNEEKKNSVQQDKQQEQDCLAKLLAKESVLQKIVYSINGTSAFTKLLAQQLKIVSDKQLICEEERTALKNELAPLKTQDQPQLYTKGGLFSSKKETPLKKVYDSIEAYFQKPANEQLLEQVRLAYADLKSPPTHLGALKERIEANHAQFASLNTQSIKIKKEITTFIEDYLTKHNNAKDDVHMAKKAVMTSIKAYVNDPTVEKWQELQQSTKDNPDWDKGLFSQVSSTMEKVTAFHDEMKPTMGMGG